MRRTPANVAKVVALRDNPPTYMSMSAGPHFSIIMPLYNHAAYVGEAVQSVRTQTLDDWELIIVDDGSKDGGEKVVDQLAAVDPRIRVIHQANAGPACARNRGIEAARAPWIAFLDSDDTWYPRTLEHYRKTIDANPAGVLVFAYWDKVRNGQIVRQPPRHQDRPATFADLFARILFGPPCVAVLRQVLLDAGGFDPQLRVLEDYDLFLRIAVNHTMYPVGHATGLRRRHDTNISADSGANRLREAQLLERHANNPAVKELVSGQGISARVGRAYYNAARQFFRSGDFAVAADVSRRSLRYRRSVKALGIFLAAKAASLF